MIENTYISIREGVEADISTLIASVNPMLLNIRPENIESSIIDEMSRLGYSKKEQALFLATVRHESDDYTRLKEIGGYRSVEQMQKAGIKKLK